MLGVLALFRAVLAEADDCAGVFELRKQVCDRLPEREQIATCQNLVTLVSPIGWAGYDSPQKFRYSYVQVRAPGVVGMLGVDRAEWNGRIPMTAQPRDREERDFDDHCPMFSYQSGRPSCCFRGGDQDEWSDNDKGWYDAFVVALREFVRQMQFRIFPKCYDLIKFLPCAICHPNASRMLYGVLPDESEGMRGLPMVQSVRLCTDYAHEIYENCRYAIYQKSESRWIVPKGFGENDFLRLVGHSFNVLGEIEDANDIPNETCLDFTPWKALEAAPLRRVPAAIVLLGMAVGALVAFF
jgi:hypothetical protein